MLSNSKLTLITAHATISSFTKRGNTNSTFWITAIYSIVYMMSTMSETRPNINRDKHISKERNDPRVPTDFLLKPSIMSQNRRLTRKPRNTKKARKLDPVVPRNFMLPESISVHHNSIKNTHEATKTSRRESNKTDLTSLDVASGASRNQVISSKYVLISEKKKASK